MSMSSIHWPICFKWHKWDLLIINHILNYCMTPSNVYDQVKYFSMVSFCTLVLMKINSLKKKIFSITNVCLRFSFHSDWKVSWMLWPETDGVTHLPAPIFIFFFSKNYHNKRSTLFDLYVALSTLLNFSSGSAHTHAFQMVLKKASLWLLSTLLLAYSRSHYAVTFGKKLRQKAYFCFQLRSSVSIRKHNHDFQVQNNLVRI